MKKTLLFLSLFAGIGSTYSQIVNIPDANFKAYLVGDLSINTNGDTEIQVSEASTFDGSIICNGLSIADLTGIEAFTALTQLYCYNNLLTDLDVSNNTALTQLACGNNLLTVLNVTSNVNLTYLQCIYNQLTTLNVSSNVALTQLDCYNNQLTALNVSNNTALTQLECGNNQLTTLDVSGSTALTQLYCYNNQLTNLDVSNHTGLTQLNCRSNQLTSLNVSANTALQYLQCYDNLLTTLNISGSTALSILYCYNNQLTTLNVSSNTALIYLQCYNNLLTDLNVKNTNNTTLTAFDATNNPNLTCIEVDDAAYSTTNWTNIDATASFSENCSGGVGIEEFNTISMTIYPNPVSSILTIETEAAIESIHIFNVNGALVQSETTNKFSVESLMSGVYLINVITTDGVITKRFVKE